MEHQTTFQPSLRDRIAISVFRTINKYVSWFRLPGIIGALNLSALRIELRGLNLYDSYASPSEQGNPQAEPLTDSRYKQNRHPEGKFNSLEAPLMGCAGMRFGRNFPRQNCQKPTEEELWTPNPRTISERFMARKSGEFIPATKLNLLAAAWIQFQTHDWFNHENVSSRSTRYSVWPRKAEIELTSKPEQSVENHDIPLPNGDQWPYADMKLPKSLPDAILDPSDIKCPGYKNTSTAWWDGSQIYGSSEKEAQRLRTQLPDGKLMMNESGMEAFLPRDVEGNPLTGFNTNWWVGMEMMHTLFALEHNAICDMLRQAYPNWPG